MDTTMASASPKLNIGDRGITINKNFLIALLVFLLIFSLLGINVLHIFGNLFQIIGNLFQSITGGLVRVNKSDGSDYLIVALLKLNYRPILTMI